MARTRSFWIPFRTEGRPPADGSRSNCFGLLASAAVLAFGLTCCSSIISAAELQTAAGQPGWNSRRTSNFRLAAEFDRQEAILVSWDADDAGMQAGVVDIIAAAYETVSFVMLVPNADAEADATFALRQAGIPRRAVRFLQVPTDSVWTRDFGPMVVHCKDGTCRLVDSDYGHGDRVGDDLVPAAIAPTLGMKTLRPPITADGGNIQNNGRGLAITTASILEHNVERRYTQDDVARLFRDYYGINDLVFLEALEGESTGHVDMFAVFVSPDTVVVGAYDHDEDPVNAELLDRNAARLRRVQGPNGPLRVVRIPMPPRTQKIWRTYTNVLFANGTLVVPMYRSVDPDGHATAVDIYRRLLPEWKVVGVDCTRLIRWGGAIHCMTMNLARVPALENEDGRLPFVGSTPETPAEEQRVRIGVPERDEPRRPLRNIRPEYSRRGRQPRQQEFQPAPRHMDDSGWNSSEPSSRPGVIDPEWYPHRPRTEPLREEQSPWENPRRRLPPSNRPGEWERRRSETDNEGLPQTADASESEMEFPMPTVKRNRRLMFTPDANHDAGASFEPFDAGQTPTP